MKLAFILILFKFSRALFPIVGKDTQGTHTLQRGQNHGVPSQQSFLNAEASLAQNQKVLLDQCDLICLESLPLVPAATAIEIDNKRLDIKDAAARLPPNEQHTALELIRGIGSKRARSMGRFISFSEQH